jgi:hypothetical protein
MNIPVQKLTSVHSTNLCEQFLCARYFSMHCEYNSEKNRQKMSVCTVHIFLHGNRDMKIYVSPVENNAVKENKAGGGTIVHFCYYNKIPQTG